MLITLATPPISNDSKKPSPLPTQENNPLRTVTSLDKSKIIVPNKLPNKSNHNSLRIVKRFASSLYTSQATAPKPSSTPRVVIDIYNELRRVQSLIKHLNNQLELGKAIANEDTDKISSITTSINSTGIFDRIFDKLDKQIEEIRTLSLKTEPDPNKFLVSSGEITNPNWSISIPALIKLIDHNKEIRIVVTENQDLIDQFDTIQKTIEQITTALQPINTQLIKTVENFRDISAISVPAFKLQQDIEKMISKLGCLKTKIGKKLGTFKKELETQRTKLRAHTQNTLSLTRKALSGIDPTNKKYQQYKKNLKDFKEAERKFKEASDKLLEGEKSLKEDKKKLSEQKEAVDHIDKNIKARKKKEKERYKKAKKAYEDRWEKRKRDIEFILYTHKSGHDRHMPWKKCDWARTSIEDLVGVKPTKIKIKKTNDEKELEENYKKKKKKYKERKDKLAEKRKKLAKNKKNIDKRRKDFEKKKSTYEQFEQISIQLPKLLQFVKAHQ
jgi:DNA repair exonuclease SbcCD ATPase subunit